VGFVSAEFLSPLDPIDIHGNKLPHWQQGRAWQFITFRLRDSLPADFLNPHREQRKAWLALHPKPWSAECQREYHNEFTKQIEELLDRGCGACVLRNPEKRQALAAVLMRDETVRAEFACWVIMPNHVHVLCSPGTGLSKLVGSWKSISAREIGDGALWQTNYRDTIIRNAVHFAAVVRYIRNNPANLPSDSFTLWESEQARKIP